MREGKKIILRCVFLSRYIEDKGYRRLHSVRDDILSSQDLFCFDRIQSSHVSFFPLLYSQVSTVSRNVSKIPILSTLFINTTRLWSNQKVILTILKQYLLNENKTLQTL